jgi:hypothetical protein
MCQITCRKATGKWAWRGRTASSERLGGDGRLDAGESPASASGSQGRLGSRSVEAAGATVGSVVVAGGVTAVVEGGGAFVAAGGCGGSARRAGVVGRAGSSSCSATVDLRDVKLLSVLNQNGAPRLRNSTDARMPKKCDGSCVGQ